jgi:predicted peptidase
VTEPAPLLSKSENRKRYPAFLFVPQAPPGILWGGIPNVPSIDSLVFEAMRSLEEEFEIDEKRRYVAGISGGGYGSWHFISTRPEMFAAAVPICGAGNPALANHAVKVPVWAFHGTTDRNVPVSGSREMVEAIRQAGGNPKYTEFSGVGHNVWPQVSETTELLDWLFAQKRE